MKIQPKGRSVALQSCMATKNAIKQSPYSYYYKKGPRIYSLDRIKYLHATEETFEMPKDWYHYLNE